MESNPVIGRAVAQAGGNRADLALGRCLTYLLLWLGKWLKFVSAVSICEKARHFRDFTKRGSVGFLDVNDDVNRFRYEIPQRIRADLSDEHFHPTAEGMSRAVCVERGDAALVPSPPRF
jgi:hypothetical protein